METIVAIGDGVRTRFDVPGSTVKRVSVRGLRTHPVSQDFNSVTIIPAPPAGHSVQVDYDTPGTQAALVVAQKSIAQGVRVARIGGSADARCMLSLPVTAGSVTVLNGVVSFQTDANHGLHDGMEGRLGRGNTEMHTHNSLFCAGPITRTANNRATMVYDGPLGNGTAPGVFNFLVKDRYSQHSFLRNLNAICNDCFVITANYSQGETDLFRLIPRLPALIATKPDMLIGSLGFGNLYLNGHSAAAALAILREAVYMLTDAGIKVVHQLPNGLQLGQMSPAAAAWAATVKAGLDALKDENDQYFYIDPSAWCVDPSTGASPGNWFTGPGDIHSNDEAQAVNALDCKNFLIGAGVQIPRTGPCPISIMDRMGADATSNQLLDEGWALTGITAASVETGAGSCTGTVRSDISSIVTEAGISAVASLLAEAGGFGATQRFVITAANAGVFTVNVTGALAARITARGPNRKYKFHGMVRNTPGAANCVTAYNVEINSIFTYQAGTDRSGIWGAPISNRSENPQAYQVVARGGLHFCGPMATPSTMTNCSTCAITLTVEFDKAGTSTLEFDRFGFRDVTA